MATTYTYADSSVKGTLYRGMLYDFEEVKDENEVVIGAKSTYNADYTVGTSSYREPSLVTGNSSVKYAPIKVDEGQDILGSAYDKTNFINAGNFLTAATFGKQMQEDYNEMIKSVNTYKGFYVGRFETGIETVNETHKTTSKAANSYIITADASSSKGNTWYGLYKKQKTFSINKKIKSSMIWGSQYDAMMNWMAKKQNIITEDLQKYNNTTRTGLKNTDIINNIYDLYGCHYEYTLEARQLSRRSLRGGSFTNNTCTPASRTSLNTDTTYTDDGSRITLHIIE